MWYAMSNLQQSHDLSERLIRAISDWRTLTGFDDDIEQLLEDGADINRLHGTLLPLHCACMVADSYCLQLLLQKGAEVNARDGYGRAALHYAAERDEVCLEMLLDAGADPDIPDGNQDTALHWASYKNRWQCVKVLLLRGATVDAVDFNSDTPISWAAMKGNLESLKELLDYNARVDIENYNGKTALMRCLSIQASGLNTHKDDACLDLLLRACGQFDLRDPRCRLSTPVALDNRLSQLLQYCETPQPLQNLCRHAIRRYLGPCFLPNVVPQLPIPSRLHDFALLEP